MLRTEVIKAFLSSESKADLAELYNFNMEVQVNVEQGEGELIEGEFNGRKWFGYTDGLQTWKSFRIPWNASTSPEYTDGECRFDFARHVNAIGMTGWDWKSQLSRWVAFDFDSIFEHSKGLQPEELANITQTVAEIPWVTIRKSSGGNGLHIYVFFAEPIQTSTHTEHACVARSVLGKMSALTGFNLCESVDVCGGNMWVWRRNQTAESYRLIKRGDLLTDSLPNWQDHKAVIVNKKRPGSKSDVEHLSGQYNKIKLDANHRRLINWLEDAEALWWWDSDKHMLVSHTFDLKLAHTDLGLKGLFETNATGTNRGQDQNCFAFPLRNGAWIIRRHTKGVSEHSIWDQDGEGWTRVYYNRLPDLKTVARKFQAVEDLDGSFSFNEAEVAVQALHDLGIYEELPVIFNPWPATIKTHKDNRIILTVTCNTTSNFAIPPGWLQKKGTFVKIFNKRVETPEVVEILENVDDYIRHISEGNIDQGWVMFNSGDWVNEPLNHIRLLLQTQGYKTGDINHILGSSVENSWKLVNKPFQPEYPGDREWNKDAPQLKFLPKQDIDNLHLPTWDLIFRHCGQSLDEYVKLDSWCREYGILTGAEYLKLWVASLIKYPERPLPYLFFYGPQSSGKTVFHESLRLLLGTGVIDGGKALKSQGDFNGEIYRAVLCYVEEVDLNRNIAAYNKLKDWVTAREISIHRKGQTPFMSINTTHWIQCSNDHSYCPVFPGDTRITMSYVGPHAETIPRFELDSRLIKEASDFVTQILNYNLPPSKDRLNIPVISTPDKEELMSRNTNPVEAFVKDSCHLVDGECVVFADFCTKFLATLDATEAFNWTKTKIGRHLPPTVLKGRSSWDANKVYLGNISFNPSTSSSGKFHLDDKGFLRR
jgi:hypothetical protein